MLPGRHPPRRARHPVPLIRNSTRPGISSRTSSLSSSSSGRLPPATTKPRDASWPASTPPSSTPRAFDKELYKTRHLIENFFAKLKQVRAIATRYDKTARCFLAGIHLAELDTPCL